MANQVPAPPYTPGFGRRPPVVAGRDALVDDVARVLEVGPEHPRFCRALLGSRGTGKTVLLDVIGEVASKELGWAVLHVQALQEESLVAVLLQRIPEAVRPWERFGRGSKDLQAQLNVGVGSARATVERGHNAGTGSAAAAFEDALGRVGSFAAGHGTGLLVTVDEAQMAPQEDLSALARALQTVVARRLQPVAVVFGGLQTFRERLAGAGTYASRLPVEELGNLEPSAARLALVEPAARRHVAWEDEALGLLVRRSGGHPYYVQLFGWHAWEAAQGEATITLAHAKAGLAFGPSRAGGPVRSHLGPPAAPRARLPGRRGQPGRHRRRRGRGSGQGARQRAETVGRGPRPARAHARALGSTGAGPGPLRRRRDGRVGGGAPRRHFDDHGCAEGAGALGRPGPWPAQQLALSGRGAVRAPPAERRAAPGPRALTPRAPGPGLRGQFRPAVLLATCAIRPCLKLIKANS